MTDIIKPPGKPEIGGITFSGGKLKSKSQSTFQQRTNEAKARAASVDPETMPNRILMMLDRSSSMSRTEYLKNGQSNSRIELLREAIKAFVQRCNFQDTAIAAETFPPSIEQHFTCNVVLAENFGYAIQASGSTPMHACVERCLGKYPMTRGVLVSDGEATDWDRLNYVDEDELPVKQQQDEILYKYKEAGIPIDCVHISMDTGGEELLKRIARITGGIFLKFTDVSSFATAFGYLAPGMRAMLTDGRVTAEQLGAKELKP